MLPGQWGLLIIGFVSAAALGILGWFSYVAFKKEKLNKQRQERAKRREMWHQSMTAAEQESFTEKETTAYSSVDEKTVTEVPEKPKNTRNDFDFKF